MTNDPSAQSVPPPAPPLTPHLVIAGAKQAIDFYGRAFGARLRYVNETPDGKVMHADLVLPNGGVFYLCDDFPERGSSRSPKALGDSPVTLHLEVEDVDALWKKALAAGAKVEMELADQFWGARYGMISDPFGHRWSLAAPSGGTAASQ